MAQQQTYYQPRVSDITFFTDPEQPAAAAATETGPSLHPAQCPFPVCQPISADQPIVGV